MFVKVKYTFFDFGIKRICLQKNKVLLYRAASCTHWALRFFVTDAIVRVQPNGAFLTYCLTYCLTCCPTYCLTHRLTYCLTHRLTHCPAPAAA